MTSVNKIALKYLGGEGVATISLTMSFFPFPIYPFGDSRCLCHRKHKILANIIEMRSTQPIAFLGCTSIEYARSSRQAGQGKAAGGIAEELVA